MNEKLPEYCYAREFVDTGKTIIIKRGVVGYFPSEAQEDPEELNANLGITKAQYEAMFTGSMFGWNTPGADPNNYDEDGKWNK